MKQIKIEMVDGTTLIFEHQPRPGGSYMVKVNIEGEVAVITDEYYDRTIIPLRLIKEIKDNTG